MKRLLALTLAIVVAIGVTACDDSPTRTSKPPKWSNYKDLSEPWHVLHNLERAYDDRNVNRIEELMDDAAFIFYFHLGDPGIPPAGQWDYTAEIQATTHMFNGDGGIESNPILTIDVTLFDIETAMWVEVNDHPDFPGETLRETVVRYDYFIDTAQDRQYITSGAPTSRFLVRNVGGTWKLVRWHDLSNGLLLRAGGSSEARTWGQVKALYQ